MSHRIANLTAHLSRPDGARPDAQGRGAAEPETGRTRRVRNEEIAHLAKRSAATQVSSGGRQDSVTVGTPPAPLKTALWLGLLCTVAASVLGWGAALFWVVSRGGLEHLVDYTGEIFYVSVASLWCAVIASLSAYVALRARFDGQHSQRARACVLASQPAAGPIDAMPAGG